jgi:hypothetical protein
MRVHLGYLPKLNPNYNSFDVTELKCMDKGSLTMWLRYKFALYGFHPVLTSSRKITTGHLTHSIHCEYKTKPLPNSKSTAKQHCSFRLFYKAMAEGFTEISPYEMSNFYPYHNHDLKL